MKIHGRRYVGTHNGFQLAAALSSSGYPGYDCLGSDSVERVISKAARWRGLEQKTKKRRRISSISHARPSNSFALARGNSSLLLRSEYRLQGVSWLSITSAAIKWNDIAHNGYHQHGKPSADRWSNGSRSPPEANVHAATSRRVRRFREPTRLPK